MAFKIIHVNNVWTVLYRKEINMRLPVRMGQRYLNVNKLECFHWARFHFDRSALNGNLVRVDIMSMIVFKC